MRGGHLIVAGIAVAIGASSRLSVELASHVPEYCGAALVETSAWLHDQAPHHFWSFIDRITEKQDSVSDEWDHYKKIAKEVVQDKTLNGIIDGALVGRSYSAIAGIFDHLQNRVEHPPASREHRSWLQYGDRHLFNAEKIGTLVDRLFEGKVKGGKMEDIVPAFDRYISRDRSGFPVLILWADPNDIHSWAEMHRALSKQAQIGEITYVLRFIIRNTGCKLSSESITLTGYGVSAEIKGDESEVATAEVSAADSIYKAVGLKKGGLDSYKIRTNLPESDLQELGLKAAQFITSSEDPSTAFRLLTGHFPLLAKSLAKWTPAAGAESSQKLMERLALYHRRYQLLPQVELVAVNGILVEAAAFSLAGLRAFASRYASIYASTLGKEKVSFEEAEALLQSGLSEETPIYDFRSNAVTWLCDLESDARYADEPKALTSILRYTKTGFYPIARNLVNLVLFVEPGEGRAGQLVKVLKKKWIEEGAPIRFGLVLANGDEKDDLRVFIRSFYGVLSKHGRDNAIEFLEKCEDEEDLEECYKKLSIAAGTLEELADGEEARGLYAENRKLVNRLGITNDPVIFVNGRVQGVAGSLDQAIADGYRLEISQLQQAVYKKELSDDMKDLYAVILDSRKPHLARNEVMLSSRVASWCLDPSRIRDSHWTQLMEPKLYLHPTHNQPGSRGYQPTTMTMWLIVDVYRRHEIEAVGALMDFLQTTKQPVRLQLLFANPIERYMKSLLISFRELLAGKTDLDKYAAYLEKSINLRQGGVAEFLKQPGKTSGGRRTSDYETSLRVRAMIQAVMAASGVGPHYKDPMLFINGRHVASMRKDDPKPTAEHIEMLVEREAIRLSQPGFKNLLSSPEKIVRATCYQHHALVALQSNFGTGQRDISAFPPAVPEFPSFKLKGEKRSLVHVKALIDPLSLTAQRYAQIIATVKGEKWLSGQTWLNPSLRLAHMPLSVFYGFATDKESSVTFPFATGTFAVQMDAPPAWDTQIAEGSVDPDNLALNKSAGDLDADNMTVHMRLRGLVSESKFEVPSGRSLGGLYVTAYDVFSGETIESVSVMGDINVAQFGKLTSRLYYLQIEGSASKVFGLEQHMASFCSASGRHLAYHKLAQKQPLDKTASLAPFRPATKKNDKRTHVFSIASGAMYERLMRIMVVSVAKRSTKSPVKFWLIDTFLTPGFRSSLPALAQHFDFEYELVHIRWPSWLRRQSKKHRTVWAYKVLFLDQIFPADLERVVYIDADQVVRSDLAELMGTKLNEKAPWAFVPFCDSRAETEQFRFWKGGYWKQVLENRPYHISALFLLDLPRLRDSGLADRLRRDYHMLSMDPNSLANLDQDLPNHMQDEFPIHSLPQEWLWCETWCSDETKSKAKSIDLCNYPGKKESKVEQGQRIIPEWKEFDHEIDFVIKNAAKSSSKSHDKTEL